MSTKEITKEKCRFCGSSNVGYASNISKNILTGKLRHRYVSDCYDCGISYFKKT